MNSGSGSGSYSAGSVVGIIANAPPSGQVFDQWTGDTGTVADVNAASTTLTMPAGDATVTASYQAVSSGGTFSFGPTDDAFLQGSTRFNDAYLKVEAGYRVSYLKFNVSGLSGNVQRATLRLQENGDLGSGTVRVYRGSHNNWTETTLTAGNAPLENGQVGLFGGAVGSGQVVSVDVSSWITGNGTYTAIVKLDAGGNDIWFGSEESSRKPQLIVETGDGGSPSYQLTVNSGSGSGSYAAGSVVDLVANAPPSGQVFDQWTGDIGTVADVNAASTTLTMPAGDATVTASYQAVSGGGTVQLRADRRRLSAGQHAVQRRVSEGGGGRSGELPEVQRERAVRERGAGDAAVAGERGSGEWDAAGVSRQSQQLDGNDADAWPTRPWRMGRWGRSRGAVGSGQVVSVDVSSWITGNGTYTAIVKMDAGGNDVWFGSEESARKPQLIVETGGGGSPSYQLTVNNGSGTGSYPAGTVVELVAERAAERAGVRPVDGRHRDGGGCQRGFDDDDDAGGRCHGDGQLPGGERRGHVQLRANRRRLSAGEHAVQRRVSEGGGGLSGELPEVQRERAVGERGDGRRCGCRRTGIWGAGRCGCIEAVTTAGRKRL